MSIIIDLHPDYDQCSNLDKIFEKEIGTKKKLTIITINSSKEKQNRDFKTSKSKAITLINKQLIPSLYSCELIRTKH